MSSVATIRPKELKQRLESGESVQLIDVRGEDERAFSSIGGVLIPMTEVLGRLAEIPRDKPVVVYCRSGARSERVIHALQAQHGFTNLMNLEGGILAWSDEVDPSVPKY